MRQLSDYPDADLRIFDRPPLPKVEDLRSVYLIGICGTGMGSLAGLFSESGYDVAGSDASVYPPMSDRLVDQGIPVFEGYDPSHLTPAPDLVIVGNACTPTHVEAAEARNQGLAQTSFPEALARYFIASRHSVVVTGTHGKTTTTSMLAHVFMCAGREPGFLIGGIMNDGNRSFAAGSGEYFLVEGDEYDSAYFDKRPKFVHYKPRSAIVTSVEFDHADIYEDWDEYVQAFREFAGLVHEDGLLVLNADDPVTANLASASSARIQLYGLEDASLTARNIRSSADGQAFDLVLDGHCLGSLQLSMSGRHNLLNALAVCAVALDEKLPFDSVKEALRSFSGIQRRQQIRGITNDITVIDDFAHHPTAVRATIQAISERFPDRRIVAIFEPRSNSSRRKVFEDGYTSALGHADAVFLSAPPFRHNDDVCNFMDIDTVLDHLRRSGLHAESGNSADDLLEPLLAFLRPGDVALVMSNGAFGDIHDRLLEKLRRVITS